MAITWANVINVAPDMASAKITPAAQIEILGMVDRQINDSYWGRRADDGRKYLAAHLGKLALLRGAGSVTAEQIGQMSRSYAFPEGLKGSLKLTSYGAEYQRLLLLIPNVRGFLT